MPSSLGAFELELAIEPSQLPPELKISILELSENTLYVGTNEGSILEFELGQGTATNRRSKNLGSKAPVTFLRSASALNRLIALCDATLFVVNAADLSVKNLNGSPKFKGVTACCVNENPHGDNPFSVQVCLGKKRQLAVISITEERMSVDKIKEMPSPIQAVGMDGHFVCAALETHYVLCNISTGTCQDLFPVEPDSFPVMTRVAKEEFLLSAPGGLGMFVTSAGFSERPPIQWTEPIAKFVFCHPYIIALTEAREHVEVYSVLDQKAKQRLQFFGAVTIGNFDGQLFVASASTVYRIKPVSVQLQIKYLLENERIEEALELAESSIQEGNQNPDLEAILLDARVRSAFIHLKRMELNSAKDLLIRGRADPREVICLFPRLLPASSNFTRTARALNDIPDTNAIAKNDPSKTEVLELFLCEYLEFVRSNHGENHPHKFELDTALIKMYAKRFPEKLITFLENEVFTCDVDDCKKHLEKMNRVHALGILHKRQGQYDEAITIWIQIIVGEVTDPYFLGMDYVVGVIMHAPVEIVWRYSDLILKHDEHLGVEIFIKRHNELGSLKEEDVLNFLHPYSCAFFKYLEFIVCVKESKVEYHHTQLATCYLDNISKQDISLEQRAELRHRFLKFVLKSDSIRPRSLLSRLESVDCDDFHQEKAVIFGKLGEYDKALRIFVQKLQDFGSAEEFCDQLSERDPKLRPKLLKNLMQVILDPSVEKPEQMMVQVLDLVTRRAEEMNTIQAFEMLPEFWSLCKMYPAIAKLVRASTHKRRMLELERSLCKSDNINVKLEQYQRTRIPIYIEETSYCVICQKPFKTCEFARYPNGVVIHIECVKDPNICPITGQIFSIPKKS